MKSFVIKLSGEIFKPPTSTAITSTVVTTIVAQIKQLQKTHQINIVIGGGNFFRGSRDGKALHLTPTTAHAVGMLATVMNGLMLHDLCKKESIDCVLLGATQIAGSIECASQERIDAARTRNAVIIFAGGTGCPFFSTDTAAVLRALQVGATEIWKATTVDGVYSADPATDKTATRIPAITYTDALAKQLKIVDATALCLAQEHALTIRVFNGFTTDALRTAAQNNTFGSTIKS